MGMKVIETNQTINLSTYGLKAGDEITVICVGGGGGGGGGGSGSISYSDEYGGSGGAGGNGGYGSGGHISSYGSAGGGGAGAGYGAGGGGGAGGYGGGRGDGGNAGEYKMTSVILNSTTVNSIRVTIGAAGSGGTFARESLDSGNSGENGGTTSFGTILSAGGGVGGRYGGYNLNSSSTRPWGGGAGGAGGYILPLRLYGGAGEWESPPTYRHNSNNYIETIPLTIFGGGGGAGMVSLSYPTQTQYGGIGGVGRTNAGGQTGSKGIMSKGEGVVVIIW